MLKEVKFSDKTTRLFPFQYSVTQTYVLEFGVGYIRFFSQHGVLTQTAQTITAVTKDDPGVLTYSGSDTYANGDRVYITGVTGMTQLNNREFSVANVDTGANTFELQEYVGGALVDVDTSAYGTFSAGASSLAEIFEVATDFVEADLADIRVVQSADVLYILHPDYPPQQLIRTAALTWTLSDVTLTDGPYDTVNQTTTTFSPSAATGTVTITASAITGINGDAGFAATDVGRLLRMQESTTWGYAQIIGFTSVTVVTASVFSTFTNTNAKANWRLGVWSDTTGYPSAGTFHQDRLWLGGAATYPQRIDGSRTGLYGNFSPSATNGTVADDNAVAFTFNSDDVNNLRWLVSTDKGLAGGTERGEWLVRPSALGEAITPTNIDGKPTTRRGSLDTQPVSAGMAVLFIQRAGLKLRELAYLFEIDGFKSPDMTVLAEHITAPGLTRLAYTEQPQAIVWAPRSDGVLTGFTYERDSKALGWHRHELGGQSDADGLLVPVVEDATSVPAPDGNRDELYLLVQRYINGASRRYVELMTSLWVEGTDQEDAFYLDCGWTVTNSPAAATVTGLWHLEGETVSVLIDGAVHPDVTIANGTATLTKTGSIITLGYSYQSDLVTMPAEGGAQEGTSQGKTKRIIRLGAWLLDTLGLKVGKDAATLQEWLFRAWGDTFGQPTPLFTGVRKDRFPGDYDRLAQVMLRCEGPFPATVLALMPQIETSDDS